jgi:hypothetical protein
MNAVLGKALLYRFIDKLPQDKPCRFKIDIFTESPAHRPELVEKRVPIVELDAAGIVKRWSEITMVPGEAKKYGLHTVVSGDQNVVNDSGHRIEGFCTVFTRKYLTDWDIVNETLTSRTGGVAASVVWKYSAKVQTTTECEVFSIEVEVPPRVVVIDGVIIDVEPSWGDVLHVLKAHLRLPGVWQVGNSHMPPNNSTLAIVPSLPRGPITNNGRAQSQPPAGPNRQPHPDNREPPSSISRPNWNGARPQTAQQPTNIHVPVITPPLSNESEVMGSPPKKKRGRKPKAVRDQGGPSPTPVLGQLSQPGEGIHAQNGLSRASAQPDSVKRKRRIPSQTPSSRENSASQTPSPPKNRVPPQVQHRKQFGQVGISLPWLHSPNVQMQPAHSMPITQGSVRQGSPPNHMVSHDYQAQESAPSSVNGNQRRASFAQPALRSLMQSLPAEYQDEHGLQRFVEDRQVHGQMAREQILSIVRQPQFPNAHPTDAQNAQDYQRMVEQIHNHNVRGQAGNFPHNAPGQSGHVHRDVAGQAGHFHNNFHGQAEHFRNPQSPHVQGGQDSRRIVQQFHHHNVQGHAGHFQVSQSPRAQDGQDSRRLAQQTHHHNFQGQPGQGQNLQQCSQPQKRNCTPAPISRQGQAMANYPDISQEEHQFATEFVMNTLRSNSDDAASREHSQRMYYQAVEQLRIQRKRIEEANEGRMQQSMDPALRGQ